jgi:hypothetical protein
MPQNGPPVRPDYVLPEPPLPGTPGHDEGLLDEAIRQTFPASDPPAPVQPGSTLNKTAQQHRKGEPLTEEGASGVAIARGNEPEPAPA